MTKTQIRSILTATITMFLSQFLSGQQSLVREPDMNRPVAFASFSDTLVYRPEISGSILLSSKSNQVSVQLSDNFLLEGTVIVRKTLDATRTVVIIKSTNYQGFTLTLFQQILPDGSKRYTGQIVSLKHRDAFVLQESDKGCRWVKKSYYDIINE